MTHNGNIFSWIKTKLRQDYGGRYFGIALECALRATPSFARAVLGEKLGRTVEIGLMHGDITINSEYEFYPLSSSSTARNSPRTKKRRADLAILNETGQPIALIEIKYLDHRALGNYAQTNHYLLEAAKYRNCEFIFLTQFWPDLSVERVIDRSTNATIVLWHDIYAASKKYLEFPIVKYLHDHLEEQAMTYTDSFEESAIKLLVRNGCNLPAKGTGPKLQNQERSFLAADAMKQLLSNAELLAEFVRHKANTEFGNSPIATFKFRPWVKDYKLKESDDGVLPKTALIGGDGVFFAGLKVKSGTHWGYVEVGYYICLEYNRKKKVVATVEIYCGAYSAEKDKGKERISSEDSKPITLGKRFALEDFQTWVSKNLSAVCSDIAKKLDDKKGKQAFLRIAKSLRK